MTRIEKEIDAIDHGCTRVVDNKFKVSFWAEVYDLSTRDETIGINLSRAQLLKEIDERIT
jgi:hypothetical protein